MKNKLIVSGSVGPDDVVNTHLRYDKSIDEWMNEHATGSKNSILNVLLHHAIDNVHELLEQSKGNIEVNLNEEKEDE